MTRRIGISIVFALLGFASLLLADSIYKLACDYIPGLCRAYLGPCPDIDSCAADTLKNLTLGVIYFGPAIVFGIAGYIFSKHQRTALAWASLLVSLFAVHSIVMIAVIQATSK